jgi:hypothetical protein
MHIETIAVVALVFAITTLVTAAYKQRSRDVLYGPYIAPSFQQRCNNIVTHEGITFVK